VGTAGDGCPHVIYFPKKHFVRTPDGAIIAVVAGSGCRMHAQSPSRIFKLQRTKPTNRTKTPQIPPL